MNRYAYNPAIKKPKEPLRMLHELAEEFGVTFGHLQQIMSIDSGPKPQIIGISNKVNRKNYYIPSEVRKWWKARVK